MTDATSLLLDRLHTAGLTDVVAVEPVAGGLPRGGDGTSVFVKAFGEPPAADVFTAEAKGLTVLREAGVATPEVILADRDLLVLDVLRPRPGTEAFWSGWLVRWPTCTPPHVARGSGWHRDNWLGRRRQVNTWNDDGTSSSPGIGCCAGSGSVVSGRRSTSRTGRRWSGW